MRCAKCGRYVARCLVRIFYGVPVCLDCAVAMGLES